MSDPKNQDEGEASPQDVEQVKKLLGGMNIPDGMQSIGWGVWMNRVYTSIHLLTSQRLS